MTSRSSQTPELLINAMLADLADSGAGEESPIRRRSDYTPKQLRRRAARRKMARASRRANRS